MGRTSDRRRVVQVHGTRATSRPDALAVEEPLEIRIGGRAFAVTMRTPGDDLELAAGFLVSEGVISVAEDIATIRHCDQGKPAPSGNIVDVTLAEHTPDPGTGRNFYTSSSCGICGKESLEAVRTTARWDVSDDDLSVTSELVAALPDRLREKQSVFERTGGLHAAGLFTASGELLCLREDVGRHNAVDKVVGWSLLMGRLPLRRHLLQVSGRTSFELVQKAWLAGIPLLSAVSAPSTLAVDLAAEAGMTLTGFVRGQSMNVYTGAQRITVASAAATATHDTSSAGTLT